MLGAHLTTAKTTKVGGGRCGKSNCYLLCMLLFMGWFTSAAYMEHTVLGTVSGFGISLGQMTLLIDDNILKAEVDLKEISLLPSSHSLRSQCILIEGGSTCGKKFAKR